MTTDPSTRGVGVVSHLPKGMRTEDLRSLQELIADAFGEEKVMFIPSQINIEVHYHYTTTVPPNRRPSNNKLSRSRTTEPFRRFLAGYFVQSEAIRGPLQSIQKLIGEMKQIVNNTEENYDAVHLHFADLKRGVEDLWNFVSKENLYLEEIVDMLEECLHQEKPGGMTKKKLSALSKVLDRMKEIEVRPEDVLECERILDTAGFLTIPQSDYLAGVE